MLRAGTLVVFVGAAGTLTGCDLVGRNDEVPPPDPLEPLAAEAAVLETRHRAALAAVPALAERLTAIADAHRAHAEELRKVIGRPAPSGPPPATPSVAATEPDALLADLRQAEQGARENAAKACAAAPAARAALLGSIAAARATHVEALK